MLIKLSESVTKMPGTAFGLNLPLAVFKFEVQKGAHQQSAFFKHIFDRLLPKSRFGQLPLASSEEAFLESLIRIVEMVLQESKHPVFRKALLEKVSVTQQSDHYLAITPYHDFDSSKNAFSWLFQQAQTSILGHSDDNLRPLLDKLANQFQPLINSIKDKGVSGLNTFHFLKAADELNIPATIVAKNCYLFGTGRHAQLLDSSFTESTSVIGVALSRNKLSANHYLKSQGMPTAASMQIHSVEEACTAARKIGYPVAVKPIDKDGGSGVQAHLNTEQAVRTAYVAASKISPHVMLEKHCSGIEYRVTVFKEQIIKVITRIPAAIIGDGKQSIAKLVSDFNGKTEQQKRAWNHGNKALIELNQEAIGLLHEQGLKPDSVPAKGQSIVLRRTANVSTGGTPALYTGEIHPDNQRLFIRVASTLQLDLAGIDIIMDDMSQSWLESEANILEVNAMPQLGADLTPSIYRDVLKQLLPDNPHLKLTVIIGNPDTSKCYEQLKAHLQQDDTKTYGIASRQGVFVGQEQRTRQPENAFSAIATLLNQRDIDEALVCISSEEVIKFGLPFILCEQVIIEQLSDELNPLHLSSLQHILLPHTRQNILVQSKYAANIPKTDRSNRMTFIENNDLISRSLESIS